MTLALRQDAAPVPFQEQYNQATALVKSGLLPRDVNTPEKAMAIIQKGREVGFQPMESFELITVIQGKPTVSPKGQLVQIYRSGLLENISIRDDGQACTVAMTRKGGSAFSSTFGMEDAKIAGLLGNDNWKKFPKQMRQWRAVGYCADVLFPDVTGGMYRPEEFGVEVDADGSAVIIEAVPQSTVQAVEPEPQPQVSPPPQPCSLDAHKQRLTDLYRRSLKIAGDKPTWEARMAESFGTTRLSELTEEQVYQWEASIQAAEDFADGPVVDAEATIVEEPEQQPVLVGEAPLLAPSPEKAPRTRGKWGRA